VIRGGSPAALAIALFASAGPARAALDVPGVASESTLRVVLLSTTPDDPLAGRIEAELGTIGLEVSRAVVAPGVDIDEQVRAELARGARAVVVADGHRTDVWIAAPRSDRVGLRQELEVDEDSGQQAVLALRTVEFLRISLGLVAEPPPTPPVVARSGPVAPLPPPPRRWVTADVSSGVLLSSGGGGMSTVAGVDVRAQLAGMIGAELSFYAPLVAAQLPNRQGQAHTSAWLGGGGLLLAPRSDGRFSVQAAAGAWAVLIRSTGAPVSNGQVEVDGFSVQTVRAALYARGAARLRLAPRLVLRLDLLAGTVVNAPTINSTLTDSQGSTTTTQIATWGAAFAAGLGGAELQF
jgi:hypothetical protein